MLPHRSNVRPVRLCSQVVRLGRDWRIKLIVQSFVVLLPRGGQGRRSPLHCSVSGCHRRPGGVISGKHNEGQRVGWLLTARAMHTEVLNGRRRPGGFGRTADEQTPSPSSLPLPFLPTDVDCAGTGQCPVLTASKSKIHPCCFKCPTGSCYVQDLLLDQGKRL